MATTASTQVTATRGPWRTIDIITAAMIGVVFGVAYWGWSSAYNTLVTPLTSLLGPSQGLLGGPWLIAGVVAGLVVRRPGAALFAEVLAAVVEAVLVTEWGWATVISGALQGLGVELVLARVPVPPVRLAGRRAGWRDGRACRVVLRVARLLGGLQRRVASSPISVSSPCRGPSSLGSAAGTSLVPWQQLAPSTPCRQARRRPAITRSERGAELSVENLTWRPARRRTPVLSELDLHIPSGQRVLLVGASGAGKSTLLRALAGLLLTAAHGDLTGNVLIDGQPISHSRNRPALLLQDPLAGIVAETVGRDVAFGLENLGVPRSVIWPQVRTALEASEFPYPEGHPTSALSGGESQRLASVGQSRARQPCPAARRADVDARCGGRRDSACSGTALRGPATTHPRDRRTSPGAMARLRRPHHRAGQGWPSGCRR